MKRLSILIAVVASMAVASTAIAGPPYAGKATGGVAMSGPMQYMSFSAFDYGDTGDQGTVSYTNFDMAAPGSGVWRLAPTTTLTFVLGGNWVHTMYVDTVVPLSSTSTSFAGTGIFNADPSYTWTVTGTIDDSGIDFQIIYTGTSAGYVLDAVGVISADGSIAGTSTDNWGRTLPWSMPAGSAFEVFSYTAAVTCAKIQGSQAVFAYTIPVAPLSGTSIAVEVGDNGTPGTDGDVWSFAVSSSCAFAQTFTGYPIVSGNLVVH